MTTKINPWLKEKLPEAEPRGSNLNYIIEVVPGAQEQVKEQIAVIMKIANLPQVNIIGQPADRFITITAPSAALSFIEVIPEVVKISADTLSWIRSPAILNSISHIKSGFKVPEKFDPFLGSIELSPIEIPVGPLQAIALAGVRTLAANNIIVFTTEKQRAYIGIPKANKIKTRCAVADTGLFFPHFLIHPNSKVELKSVVPFEPLPEDGLGHGTWCSTCAFGDNATHPRWGKCEGMADPEEQIHIKCLSNLGFGMTSWILEAIYKAWEYGAKVLSLSLGGPLQGSAIDDDPECRLISALKDEMICVVAAGNDGLDWSIGSPGACPDALTVGAWSITDNDLSYFSSRGPSGEFYHDNVDIWRRDLSIAGEDLIKPDLCAPGGGRVNSELQDEQLLSGCAGWMDPYSDILPGWGLMKGTSMATPAVAGAIAILYDKGIIKNVEDVKRVMSRLGRKNSEVGYGLFHFSHFGVEGEG